VPAWVPLDATGAPAIFVLDAANDRGWFNGVAYATEAALLAAIGGSKSGITRTVGPYVAPDAPELLVNGDLSDGVTGWSSPNGGLVSVVSGELVLDGNSGSSPRALHSVLTTLGKAFRLSATYRRGTAVNNVAVSPGSSTGTPAGNGLTSATSTAPVSASNTFGAEAATSYVNLLIGANPAVGTAIGDDFSVKEATPFAGFNYLGVSGEIEFTTPPAVAAAKVVLQIDDNGARNRVRTEIGTDLHLRVIDTLGGSAAASLDLGAVAVSEAHKVEFTSATHRYAARLDANPSVNDVTGVAPGLSVFRVGRSNTGETWDGAISKVTLFASERIPSDVWYGEGDSYMALAGVGGVSLSLALGTASSPIFTTALGGTDLSSQVARWQANPGLHRGILLHWDGDANGYGTIAEDMAKYATMVAGHSRFIIIPPCRRANNASDKNTATTVLQNAIAAAYPANYYDAQAKLASLSDGSAGDLAAVAAGNIPPSCLQGDLTHLTSVAKAAIATDLIALKASKGW
jgi:hypothetical protein